MATINPPTTAAGDRFSNDEHVGRVIVAANRERRFDLDTKFGPADATACDVLSLVVAPTGVTVADVFPEQLLFGNLGASVAAAHGDGPDAVVAGVLARGTASAGRSAPWILLPLDDTQTGAVNTYLDTHAAFTDRWTFQPIVDQPEEAF